MNVSTEMLQALCDNSGMRETIGTPFSFGHGGQWFDGATTGHAMVAVRSDAASYRTENAPPASKLLSDDPGTHSVSLESLNRWLEGVDWEMECDSCKGSGKHECNCCFCEVEAGETCDSCDGDRFIQKRDWVQFGRVSFDRALLAKYMQPFRASRGQADVVFRGELDPFEIRTQEWRVVVMPGELTEHERRGMVPEGLFVPR